MMNRVGVALNVSRRIALVAAAMTAVMTTIVAGAMAFRPDGHGPPAGAAQQAPPPRFELASVKPSAPGAIDEPILSMPGAFLPGGRFGALNAELEIILHRAYPEFARPELLIAPDWIADERFDIDARAATDVPIPLMRLMLRQLLADRFAMQSHTEMRLVDIYHLVLARGDGKLGPRLRSASRVCDEWNAQVAANRPSEQPELPVQQPQQPTQPAGATPCGMTPGFRDGLRTFSFGGQDLSGLATMLRGFVGTSVTDRTGLTGRFDIELSWADIPLDPDFAQDIGRSLANALEDQLGLKLQPAKGMEEVLVVDRIERPTPN